MTLLWLATTALYVLGLVLMADVVGLRGSWRLWQVAAFAIFWPLIVVLFLLCDRLPAAWIRLCRPRL